MSPNHHGGLPVTQSIMAYPRDLPKRKTPGEESEAPSNQEGPISKQKKQLLVDCLTAIIRCHLLCQPSSSHTPLSSSVAKAA